MLPDPLGTSAGATTKRIPRGQRTHKACIHRQSACVPQKKQRRQGGPAGETLVIQIA